VGALACGSGDVIRGPAPDLGDCGAGRLGCRRQSCISRWIKPKGTYGGGWWRDSGASEPGFLVHHPGLGDDQGTMRY